MTTITTGPDGEALFDGMSVSEVISALDVAAAFGERKDRQIFDIATAALRHLTAQNEWQPIETAPRESVFLYVMDDGKICLHKEDDYTEWRAYPGPAGISGVSRPTHWCPLPAPPGDQK